jgi:hypothetical protein
MGNYSLKVIYMSSGIRDWPEMLWTWSFDEGAAQAGFLPPVIGIAGA